MFVKIIIVVTFFLIIISLGTALFHLVKHKDSSEKTVKALSFRIGLSLLLLFFVFIAIMTGLIKPHGIGTQMQLQKNQLPVPETGEKQG